MHKAATDNSLNTSGYTYNKKIVEKVGETDVKNLKHFRDLVYAAFDLNNEQTGGEKEKHAVVIQLKGGAVIHLESSDIESDTLQIARGYQVPATSYFNSCEADI